MNIRLQEIYNRIENGIGVIDVGTDHGFIPAELAKCGYTGNIFASDINEGPLASARRTAEEAGVSDKITFLLSDGLSACESDKIDTIVIAGMGGDLICRILDHAPWCLSPEYKLILQPMTKAEILRYWLSYNDFAIEDDVLCEDGNIYQIIIARFGKTKHLSDTEIYTGEYEHIKNNPLAGEFITQLINRFEHAVKGLEHAGKGNDSRSIIYKDIISGLCKMRTDADDYRKSCF